MRTYAFGDSSTRGLLESYRAAGHCVEHLSPEYLSLHLDECIDRYDAFDLTLALVSDDIAARILACGRKVVGFRHPAIERKSTAASIANDYWDRSGDPAVAAQMLIPSPEYIGTALRAVNLSDYFGEFLILKGNAFAKSREGLFEHLIVTQDALEETLNSCHWAYSGIVVSDLLVCQDGAYNANGTVRKVMVLARTADVDRGAVYAPLHEEHYLISNHIDLSAVRARGAAPVSEVMQCRTAAWLRGCNCDVPHFDRLLDACSVLEPLGAILTLDVMVVNGRTWFLEANHFSATYVDYQFTGRAPIDDLTGIGVFEHVSAEEQARLLSELQLRIRDCSM